MAAAHPSADLWAGASLHHTNPSRPAAAKSGRLKQAGSAVSGASFRVDIQVVTCEFVAVDTMGLRGFGRRDCFSTEAVGSGRYGFQMVWVAAGPNAAQMV